MIPAVRRGALDAVREPLIDGAPPVRLVRYGPWFFADAIADAADPATGVAPNVAAAGTMEPRKTVWQGPLALAEDKQQRGMDIVVRDGRVYLAYATVAGTFRLLARSLATGAVLWKQSFARPNERSSVLSFKVTATRMYLPVDDTLFVTDAATGALLAHVPAS